MSEDLKPLYDIESYWCGPYSKPGSNDICFWTHTEHPGLVRVINHKDKTVYFTDTERVPMENVIDINHPISDELRSEILPIILHSVDTLKPVTMPYAPEVFKVYVECTGDRCCGLLYLRSGDEMTPIRRYFHKPNDDDIWQEIDMSWYLTIKEGLELASEKDIPQKLQ